MSRVMKAYTLRSARDVVRNKYVHVHRRQRNHKIIHATHAVVARQRDFVHRLTFKRLSIRRFVILADPAS